MSSASQTDRSWYAGVTRYQWTVLLIASLGWVFDVFQGQLFAIYKTPAMTSVLGPAATAATVDRYANIAFASFLVGGALGGLFFGMLADRIGRRQSMVWSILIYSVFSGLHYFANTCSQIVVLRFLVAIGVGGEWAIAASLVAEVFTGKSRALFGGIFHASSILGVVLAALQGMFISGEHWRAAFAVGFLPALLVVWVLASLKESDKWLAAKNDAAAGSTKRENTLVELMRDRRWRNRALIGFAMAAIGLGTYWGIYAWSFELVGEVLGDVSDAERASACSFAYLVLTVVGGLPGQLAFAPITVRLGRRATFALYYVGALITVPIAFLLASSYIQTVVLLTISAVFTAGMHAGYAIYFPEMFPTRLRATGASFCFNLGRLGSAVLLLCRGEIRGYFDSLYPGMGLRYAVSAMSLLFIVGLILLWFAPETNNKELPE
jgi:MFS family permease